MAVRTHRVSHERAHVLDFPGPAGIQERRVQVQVRLSPFDGCTPQRFHGLVEPLRDSAHRRASHALTQQGLGHVAHLALRHAAHVGLYHHRIDFFGPALVATHHVGGRAAFPAARDRHVDLTQAREQAPQVRAVVLDQRVERRQGGTAPAVDGPTVRCGAVPDIRPVQRCVERFVPVGCLGRIRPVEGFLPLPSTEVCR